MAGKKKLISKKPKTGGRRPDEGAAAPAASPAAQPPMLTDLKSMSREELMAELSRLQSTARSSKELLHLVHELETHQEELRIQTLQLTEARAELERSRDRYAELYDYSPVPNVTLDGYGLVEQISLTGAELLGLERARIVGRPLLSYVAEPDRRLFMSHLRKCRSGQRLVTTELGLLSRTREAGIIPVQLCSRLAPGDRDSHTSFLTSIINLTERKQAEEALQRSQAQLRRNERLASIGTLAAGVAHEINNPLNSILLLAQYTRQSPQEDSFPEVLDAIIGEAKRCGRIVRDVLRFSREETSVRAPLDLHALIRRTTALARSYLPCAGWDLRLNLAGHLPPVNANSTEMEQVLLNLIKNAVESARGGQVQVVIRSGMDDGRVRIEVEDNGPGIPDDVLPFIFDPFYTTRQAGGGTGLGLSICHSIITHHGGTISVQSRLGHGSTFTIRLPVSN